MTEDGERERVLTELNGKSYSFAYSSAGLDQLKTGLRKAGLSPDSFDFKVSRSPYPGLVPLEEEDAAIFFGRDAQLVRALDELRTLRETAARQIYVILGASGTGKSSFLRAGLLARLKRDDRNFLPLPAVRPLDAAITGARGLAQAIHVACKSLGLPKELGQIKNELTSDAGFEALIDAIRNKALSRNSVADPSARAPIVVLPIDQAEELGSGLID